MPLRLLVKNTSNVPIVGAWQTRTTSALWTSRDGAMLDVIGGNWFLYGGWNSEPGRYPEQPTYTTTNAVYKSTDQGATWTRVLTHDDNPGTARWKRRHWGGCIKSDDGFTYILGGDHFSAADADFSGAPSNGYQSDVWRTPDGVTWERRATSNSTSWSGRMLAVFGASPGKLWCFGGQNGLRAETAGNCVIHNDLHVSVDGGATWTPVLADAAPSATRPSGRGIVNRLVYWQGLMWLVGGGTYDCALAPNRQYFREVWTFNPENPGAGWTKHTNPPWIGVQYNCVELFQNRLWLFGGYTGVGYTGGDTGQNTRTCWSTGDGERWRREETPGWPRTHADGTCSAGGYVARAAGNGGIAVNVSRADRLDASMAGGITVPSPRAAWAASSAVVVGTTVSRLTDTTGNGHHLDAYLSSAPQFVTSDADYGGKPSVQSAGGAFLQTVDAIDLSTFTIFMVAKANATPTTLFYLLYALASPNYVYLAESRSGIPSQQANVSYALSRGGTVMSGADNELDQTDLMHVYCLQYSGASATSFVRIDGAIVLPDDNPIVGSPGAGAFSAKLSFLADNTGAGARAGKLAAARVYPLLSLAQIQAVESELRTLYPYKAPV